MKIAIYANELTRPGEFGVKTYSREIIEHLISRDPKNRYLLYASRDIRSQLPVAAQRAELRLAGEGKRFWAFREFPRLIKRDAPDVVFLPIQTMPFFSFGKHKPKVVVTVHDVAFLLFPEQFTRARRILLGQHTRRAIRQADRIIVPSAATRNDLLRFYGVKEDRIAVIPHGGSQKMLNLAGNREAEAKRRTEGKPYVLFVGSIQPRKNLGRLMEAFALIKAKAGYGEWKLVLCGGKGWMYEPILAKMEKSPVCEDIIWIPDADNQLLAGLYQGASIFTLPSLYEGFGLPVLEAMGFGLPVVCGDNSSLSEIAGGAGVLVDALSVPDIARGMESLMASQSLRAELSQKSLRRAQDFSWEKAAEKTLGVLEG